ncbi:MAG: HAMP domain-containing histidine kinase [Oscillospiraceae bacterium]|nr:HAMP domain-containing histidine kinase [Oscillospiraceae bacterium]
MNEEVKEVLCEETNAPVTPVERPAYYRRLPITHSVVAKVVAVFLLFVFGIVGTYSAMALIWCANEGVALDGSTRFYETPGAENDSRSYAHRMVTVFEDGRDISEIYTPDVCSAAVSVYPLDDPEYGHLLARNYSYVNPAYIYEFYDIDGYRVTVELPYSFTAHDWYYNNWIMFSCCEYAGWWLIVALAVCLIMFVADIVFLCCSAGRRRQSFDVVLGPMHKIPMDLFIAGCVFLCVIAFLIADSMWYPFEAVEQLIYITVLACFWALMALAALMTVCARVKAGKWWRNNIIFYVIKGILWVFKAIGRGIRRVFRLIPVMWKGVLILFAVCVIEIVFAVSDIYTGGFIIWLVIHIPLVALALWGLIQFKMLDKAAERLAAGDVEYKTDTGKMYFAFKRQAESLNSAAEGLSVAVGQKMRSERMKTELITNVSHDIKTPLTSIVNYVDLLQKDPTEEQRSQYLEVLHRQALRLKKLTEDLIEASKASTGNINVNLASASAAEIINQTAGEYIERLAENGLEPVIILPENPVSVICDGRLLWRVLDNLMNNVCKYAQSGTRVYIQLERRGEYAAISVKNVSRERLNVSSEELMERFVRGDASRNTEGSGLGLNIARSLVELQEGNFNINIDGDYFKAEIILPVSPI